MNPFQRAFDKLASLTNWERTKPDRPYRFDLEQMRQLCERLGRPQDRIGKVVQIAGSKGKGTVTALLAGLCKELGMTTCAYFSPHVFDVCERIQFMGEPAKTQELIEPLERVVDAMGAEQTWFEAFTAVALLYFADKEPELSILEVGLGGRLDSTNIVDKDLCCITNIELEHTQVLGNSICEIAREKAGIMTTGTTCVTAVDAVALAVLERRADELQCPLLVAGRDFSVEVLERSSSGMAIRLEIGSSRSWKLHLPVYSATQAESFALAMLLLGELDPSLLEPALALDPSAWLPAALPAGRFQVYRRDPPIVIDGAHTDRSLELLAHELDAAFPHTRFNLVFGIAEGKRWRRGLGHLATLADRAWVAPLDGKVSEDPKTLRKYLESMGTACECCSSIEDALVAALRSSKHEGIVVTGSLYAAGAALNCMAATGIEI